MLRTQIYIPEDIYLWLMRKKKAEGISMGEFIRDNLKKLKKKEESEGNNLLDLAKLSIKGGPKDLSKNFHKYLIEAITDKK